MTEDGRRCREREGLCFHHRKPDGRGGDHSVDNICLLCRCHNGYLAERDYGKKLIERYRQSSSSGRVSELTAIYAVGHRAFDLLGPDRAGLKERNCRNYHPRSVTEPFSGGRAFVRRPLVLSSAPTFDFPP